MKRRSFLMAFASAAAFAGWRFVRGTDEDAIVAVVNKRLNYLKLDPADVRRFARNLAATDKISSGRLRVLTAAGPLYSDLAWPNRGFPWNGVRHGEERVVSIFLLSSDFFLNGADVSRPVRYLGEYDPIIACRNPFARPVIWSEPAAAG